MGEQPDDNVTAVACQQHAQQKLKCVLAAGKTHSRRLQNCFEVNVWQLPDAVVKNRLQMRHANSNIKLFHQTSKATNAYAGAKCTTKNGR